MKIYFRFFQTLALLLMLIMTSLPGLAQDCEVRMEIILKNSRGGFYSGEKITLIPAAGGSPIVAKSNGKGVASVILPCQTRYKLSISNHSRTRDVDIPDYGGGTITRTLTYAPDIKQTEKFLAMTGEEKASVWLTASRQPDTIFLKNPFMRPPEKPEHFSQVTIHLEMVDGTPLAGEKLWVSGVKSGKSIKGSTGTDGEISLYLPKCDSYTLNFKYNAAYAKFQTSGLRGTSTMGLTFSYLGTREIGRRKKIEAERILEMEKKLKEEEERFAAHCRKLGITAEEGRKLELEKLMDEGELMEDTVILAVLNRNKWKNKLIVCDLTGSMQPYSAQLSLWYQLKYQLEKDLQFVFFNDGDNKPDAEKEIGETGGIYYSPGKGIEELINFAVRVSSAGFGGDVAENNMEALIKGTRMAGPFKELIMIVDNHSPVKDLELLDEFNIPVRIIVCGVNEVVRPDYLLIAWQTKGSIHTMEEDIHEIATMMEGQEIKINGSKYKIMGGEFVQISKS